MKRGLERMPGLTRRQFLTSLTALGLMSSLAGCTLRNPLEPAKPEGPDVLRALPLEWYETRYYKPQPWFPEEWDALNPFCLFGCWLSWQWCGIKADAAHEWCLGTVILDIWLVYYFPHPNFGTFVEKTGIGNHWLALENIFGARMSAIVSTAVVKRAASEEID